MDEKMHEEREIVTTARNAVIALDDPPERSLSKTHDLSLRLIWRTILLPSSVWDVVDVRCSWQLWSG